jgi:hypothetical protein
MRNKRNVTLLAASLLLASSTLAQVRSWQNVQGLPPGAPISVEAAHRISCTFDAATDEELVCEQTIRSNFMLPGSYRYRFERRSVRQVRMERPEKGALIGAGIGAAAGAALGAATWHPQSGYTHGGTTFISGALGALFGGVIGHHFGHGEIIYGQ